MATLTTFDSTKESLLDLLGGIAQGKTQLPDFQRGWVWDDEHIRSLLASVSLSYPIGAVMMLQEGGGMQFKPRPIEGADVPPDTLPERLILDGQQRLTSLFQALRSGQPVETRDARGKPIRRWYYLDINKALRANGDRDEAIVGVPEDRRVVTFRGDQVADYSSTVKECDAELLPLSAVIDTSKLTAWMMIYLQRDPGLMAARLARWSELTEQVISCFQQYQVPLIILRKETPKEAVCQVFEKVNTGGVSLTVFELLTATYAAEGFHLRPDWEQRKRKFDRDTILAGLENTDFLQAVALISTRARRQGAIAAGTAIDAAPGISCKRKDILRLTLDEYRRWADTVEEGYRQAARLIFSQKIFSSRDVPYRTQLTPLAAIFAELGKESENDGIRQRLLRWYWCGVFGELYGGATETRFAKDLPEVLAWIAGGGEPSTISDATFARSRLLTLRTRNSAAYKGVSALLMRDGGEDFRSGQPIDVARYFDQRIDIHHIFPQHWCETNGVEPQRCDSIVNKTPIAAATNRSIGGRAPSKYLVTLQNQAEIERERMDVILRSHAIEPGALRADEFDRFFDLRAQMLLDRVHTATGRTAEQLAGGGESAEGPPDDYETTDANEVTAIRIEPDTAQAQFIAESEQVLEGFRRLKEKTANHSDFEQALGDFGAL